jgi:CDP-diacylglycerol--glycerol-3-phosphate 3-phosphatidyltransferase
MANQQKKGMNLPNKLTVLRICLVPIFIVVMMLPASVLDPIISGLIGVAIFIVASFTDMLDGKIARKYGLVTDFGKLMDPLADKFMVIGALAVIVYRAETAPLRLFFTLVLLVVIFRELAVTSMRLVASTSSGAVVAANMLGKIKTVMQIVFVSTVFIEPALYAIPVLKNLLPDWWVENVPLSYVTGALTLLFTVWSGINYFIGMWKYLDPEK